MSASKNEFQELRLPGIALADMFRQHLVIVDTVQAAPASPGPKAAPAPLREEAAPLPAEPPVAPAKPVVPAPPAPAPEAATATLSESPLAGPPFPVLGKFSRQVLVVLHDAQAVHCNDDALAFLTKVISAVGLSMEHIAILNTRGKQVSYPDLKAQLPAKVAIYFGVEPASIGVPMRLPHFQVQPWDGCTFLYAPSLAELNGASAQQVELKKQLWMALKKIFG